MCIRDHVLMKRDVCVAQKEGLRKMIEGMGGDCHSAFTSEATHVVADTAESDKCRTALQRAAAGEQCCSVVRPTWVKESWEKGSLAEAYEHRVPSFRETLIACTSFGTSGTPAISRKIERGGATFMAELNAECSYLVANHCAAVYESNKYKYALKKGIPIVTEKWLDDCLTFCMTLCPDEHEDYTVPPAGSQALQDVSLTLVPLAHDFAADSVHAWSATESEVPSQPHSSSGGVGRHFEGMKMAFACDVDDKLRKVLVKMCRAGGGSSAAAGVFRGITHFVAHGATLSDADVQTVKVKYLVHRFGLDVLPRVQHAPLRLPLENPGFDATGILS